MSIPRYQEGETVRVLVEGTVVHHAPCESPYPGALTIAVPMKGGTYEVSVPLVGAVTVERLVPVEGKPRPGEICADAAGAERFAYKYQGSPSAPVFLQGADGTASPWQNIHNDAQLGPIARVYPPAPAPGTGGQAEQPAAPRVMVNDRWKDGDGEIWWGATNAFGEPGLTLGDRLCTWGEVDGAYGPLTLIERGGYCPTEDVVLAARLKPGMVVSHPDRVGGAPVRVRAVRAYETATYELLGDRAISGRQVLPGATLTLWDEIAGGAR